MGTNIYVFADKVSIGVKFVSFSTHPKGDTNADLMPLKFDPKGAIVFNPGGTLNFDFFIKNDFMSLKLVQGFYADCALQFLGYSHLGFRLTLFQTKHASMNLGIGPTFIYRQSWYKLPGYKAYPNFFNGTKNENWEYSFIWYGGEIELNFPILKNTDFSMSIIPGGIEVINVSLGFRYTVDIANNKNRT